MGYKCNFCVKFFSTEHGLKIHQGRMHQNNDCSKIQSKNPERTVELEKDANDVNVLSFSEPQLSSTKNSNNPRISEGFFKENPFISRMSNDNKDRLVSDSDSDKEKPTLTPKKIISKLKKNLNIRRFGHGFNTPENSDTDEDSIKYVRTKKILISSDDSQECTRNANVLRTSKNFNFHKKRNEDNEDSGEDDNKTQSTKKLNALNSQNYISKKSTIGAIISEIETPENSENEDSTTTPKQKIRNKDVLESTYPQLDITNEASMLSLQKSVLVEIIRTFEEEKNEREVIEQKKQNKLKRKCEMFEQSIIELQESNDKMDKEIRGSSKQQDDYQQKIKVLKKKNDDLVEF